MLSFTEQFTVLRAMVSLLRGKYHIWSGPNTYSLMKLALSIHQPVLGKHVSHICESLRDAFTTAMEILPDIRRPLNWQSRADTI